MKKLNLVIILLICIVDLACQKRKYPPELEQLSKEDIFFTGSVGDEAINLKLGTDGYYCYSSFNQGNDSIYKFIGELKKNGCEECSQSMRLELSDYKQRLPGESIDAATVFELGKRGFISEVTKINTLKFSSGSNKEISSRHWDLSDGSSSQDSVLIVDYSLLGLHTVSLTVNTTGNCKSTVINKIFVGGTTGIFACNISASTLSTSSASFSNNLVGGKAPYTYTWSFGDGSSSNQNSPSHTYQWTGSYPVKLIIEDAEQNRCESNYIFITDKDNSSCSAMMSIQPLGSRNLIFNGVKIQWKDQANVVFKSDSVPQTSESYFEIIESKEFQKNERGESGRLLTMRFNVLISDGSRKMWFKTDNSAIAVTYK